jgi:hypothetical protein
MGLCAITPCRIGLRRLQAACGAVVEHNQALAAAAKLGGVRRASNRPSRAPVEG